MAETIIVLSAGEQASKELDEEEEEEEPKATCCCAPGGCCTPVPVREIRTKGGELARLNIPYSRTSGCGCPRDALEEEEMKAVPPPLAERGLGNDQWLAWIGKLGGVNGNMACDCPRVCLTIFFVLLCFWSGLLCLWCRIMGKDETAWSNRLEGWQDEFNKVLAPLGIFVKSQSRAIIVNNGQSRSKYVARWLAFALKPASIAKLKDEPHILGDWDDYTCCWGVDERNLCMQP